MTMTRFLDWNGPSSLDESLRPSAAGRALALLILGLFTLNVGVTLLVLAAV
jgi:hypothetical protein